MHHSFEGEAVLSVGKAIDYMTQRLGIVNVMPFTCMPGPVASAVLKPVREDHDNIPLLNIAYEGRNCPDPHPDRGFYASGKGV